MEVMYVGFVVNNNITAVCLYDGETKLGSSLGTHYETRCINMDE